MNYRSCIGIMEEKTEATIMGICIYMDIRGVTQNELLGHRILVRIPQT